MPRRVGKVRVDAAAGKLNEILEKYGVFVGEMMNEAVVEAAEEAAKIVREGAPGTGPYKNTIDYKSDSWKKGTRKGKSYAYVYAQDGGYQIAHLLEHGHATRKGPRKWGKKEFVDPSPKGGHWAPAEEKSLALVVEKLTEKLKEASGAIK